MHSQHKDCYGCSCAYTLTQRASRAANENLSWFRS